MNKLTKKYQLWTRNGNEGYSLYEIIISEDGISLLKEHKPKVFGIVKFMESIK